MKLEWHGPSYSENRNPFRLRRRPRWPRKKLGCDPNGPPSLDKLWKSCFLPTNRNFKLTQFSNKLVVFVKSITDEGEARVVVMRVCPSASTPCCIKKVPPPACVSCPELTYTTSIKFFSFKTSLKSTEPTIFIRLGNTETLPFRPHVHDARYAIVIIFFFFVSFLSYSLSNKF